MSTNDELLQLKNAIVVALREILATETERDVAQKAGVSPAHINHIKNGRRSPTGLSLETFLKMFPRAEIKLNANGNTFSGNVSGHGIIQNNVSVSGDNHVHNNCPQTPQENELLERFRKLALSKQAKIICLLDSLEK